MLEQKVNRYLWSGNSTDKAKAKVSWVQVCVPKDEEGLGLKCLTNWNNAVVLRHIWSLFTKVGSLWVAW
jgi:hypothetical protein